MTQAPGAARGASRLTSGASGLATVGRASSVRAAGAGAGATGTKRAGLGRPAAGLARRPGRSPAGSVRSAAGGAAARASRFRRRRRRRRPAARGEVEGLAGAAGQAPASQTGLDAAAMRAAAPPGLRVGDDGRCAQRGRRSCESRCRAAVAGGGRLAQAGIGAGQARLHEPGHGRSRLAPERPPSTTATMWRSSVLALRHQVEAGGAGEAGLDAVDALDPAEQLVVVAGRRGRRSGRRGSGNSGSSAGSGPGWRGRGSSGRGRS